MSKLPKWVEEIQLHYCDKNTERLIKALEAAWELSEEIALPPYKDSNLESLLCSNQQRAKAFRKYVEGLEKK